MFNIYIQFYGNVMFLTIQMKHQLSRNTTANLCDKFDGNRHFIIRVHYDVFATVINGAAQWLWCIPHHYEWRFFEKQIARKGGKFLAHTIATQTILSLFRVLSLPPLSDVYYNLNSLGCVFFATQKMETHIKKKTAALSVNDTM